ncbi:hypothetical protein KY337_05340 [Candidatus Woesearchaeota archaeon]|nr:hypothetical protein [Candidatus Woesearchaeota archaeon]
MKQKNAQVSIQFNWIFVLIAGAIILLFFAGLALRQRSVSETKYCGSVLNNLDATFSLVAESAGTQKALDLPKQIIEIDCQEYRCSGTEDIPAKALGNLPAFAPSILDGTTADISSLEWDMPFRAVNFLYITTKEVRYYVVGIGLQAQNIFDKMPDNVTKEFIAPSSTILDHNDRKVRFIFVDTDIDLASALYDYKDEDVSALKVFTNSKIVEFYTKQGNDFVSAGESGYVNEVDLLAAIFSDNIDNFECGMKKAYERLNHVTIVNLLRIMELSNSVDQASACPYIYDSVYNLLLDLRDYSEECMQDVDPACVSTTHSSAINLRNYNNDLIREGCPLLY